MAKKIPVEETVSLVESLKGEIIEDILLGESLNSKFVDDLVIVMSSGKEIKISADGEGMLRVSKSGGMIKKLRNAQRNYVGKWVKHSAKAIIDGHPDDRWIAICSVSLEGNKVWLEGWKCTYLGAGRVDHPAYGEIDISNPLNFSPKTGANGAGPTMYFYMDSYYQLV